jgi:mannosyl-3-phosphoglycerate phosphatase
MKRDVSPNRGNKDDHKKEEQSGAHPSPFIVIFTDLDGTLLDHNSYGWQEAEPALRLCKERQIPLIPVSSKTRAEIRILQQELGLSSPFISENGGGIFFPKEGKHSPPSDAILSRDVWKWSIGPAYDRLVKALGEIQDEQGWKIRGFSEMTPEEISGITGLDLASARLASQREYDEPFVLMEEEGICDMDALNHAASQKGLRITRGGRFYHLHGKGDKGEAMERLTAWYRTYHPSLLTIALGDSPVDFSMFKRADYPVLIRSSNQYPELKKVIPRLKLTQEPGPKGWNAAVLGILNDEISIG